MKSSSRLLALPVALALTPPVATADVLVVLNKSGHEAVLVDPPSLEIVKRLATGTGPHEAATSPDGRRVYVANYGAYRLFREDEKPQLVRGHTLSVIDLVAQSVVDTIDLGEFTMPHGMRVSRDGALLWVTCEGAHSVVEIATADGRIVRHWRTEQEISHMLVATPDERKLYVANIGSGSCTVIRRESGDVVSIPTGAGAEGIDMSADGREVWVTNRAANTVSVIDVARDTVIATLASEGVMPIRARFTPDGREVWVSCMRSDAIHVFDAKTRAIVARIAVEKNPVGIEMSSDGRRAYVASTTADRITVVDVRSRTATGGFSPGSEPDGMAWASVPLRGR